MAYVGPADGAESTADRWRGFSQALGRHGASLALHMQSVGGDPEGTLKAVQESGATAVFLTHLADAITLKRVAVAAGLAVPGDLSVVVLGSHIRPTDTGTRFTTYSIPREEMGRRATEALVGMLESRTGVQQILLDCETVEGETLGPIRSGE
jgi:DNA-binding LacI/PurR family transcriptional regulator